jgi:hypothetical protein
MSEVVGFVTPSARVGPLTTERGQRDAMSDDHTHPEPESSGLARFGATKDDVVVFIVLAIVLAILAFIAWNIIPAVV